MAAPTSTGKTSEHLTEELEVKLVGLSKTELNEKKGTLIKFHSEKRRWEVDVEGTRFFIKTSNILPVSNLSEEGSRGNENIRRMASIIAIGNPGAGKSTMLNSLAGEILFQSGASIGDGLTYQLEEKMNQRGTFFDTPGLSDDSLREAAGKAISTALRKGGPYKILFFVRLESGRIVREDITTMRLVLDSAPEIGNKYGIVTNKLPSEISDLLQDPNQAEKLLIKLFASIPEEKRCALTSVTYLPYRREAESKSNYLLHSNSVITADGIYFEDFVNGRIETVQLTGDQAKDIKTGNFDNMTKIIEDFEKKLEENRELLLEQQRWMRTQMENAKKELQKQRTELSDLHERNRKKEQRKKEKCKVM